MSETSPADTRRGRLQFLLILALFTVPLLTAVGWYALAPGSAPAPATHGALIDPARPLEAFSVPASGNGDAFTLEDLRGRWTLVQMVDQACDAACAERLYYTRQIREALGRDRQRVQRVVLARSGRRTQGLEPLLAEHPDLLVLTSAEAGPLRGQLPAGVDARTVLLIDPLGNLMMRFDPDVPPDGILEDLEKLLKLSQVG